MSQTSSPRSKWNFLADVGVVCIVIGVLLWLIMPTPSRKIDVSSLQNLSFIVSVSGVVMLILAFVTMFLTRRSRGLASRKPVAPASHQNTNGEDFQ